MATLGHVAVGLAAARAYQHGRPPRWPAAAFWSALAVLPDADIIGLALGVEYAAPWGHRGASHSLAFAAAVGAIVGLVATWFKAQGGRTALLASVAVASHGLLDTLTDGGLGCALLWPFDLTRYFAPWQPLPVAPIGAGMLSPYGAIVVLAELVFFAPALFFALRPTTVQPKAAGLAAFAGLWVLSVWLLISSDPVRESIVGFVLRDRTVYTTGFSEQAFRTIERGVSDQDVQRLLGLPYGEAWFYPPTLQPFQRASETGVASLRECRAIRSENSVVVMADEPAACRALGIQPGTPLAEVRRLLGPPNEMCWQYSRTPGFALRLRLVCFEHGRVDEVIGGWVPAE